MTDTNRKKILTFLIATMIILVIGILGMIYYNGKNVSRTIMIYMVGNDLESEYSLATIDLKDIKYEKMDNKNIKVVVIAGGTKKWYNDFIDQDETSIYELTSDGYKKVLSQELQNMGDSQVLNNFLNYVTDNYKSDKYDLIFWNHGGAIYGSEFDELYNNENLSLEDLSNGLKNTKFSKKNKIETIIFSTCLNGTIEVADLFKDYADYLVASEEITMGTPISGDLNFINKVTTEDDGYEFGVKFVNSYKGKINDYKTAMRSANSTDDYVYSTYSVIRLDKVKKLVDSVNEFFENITVSSNYNTIAKVRSNLYQYGLNQGDDAEYDMVDLYNLVNELRDLAPKEADKVLKNINNTILYNYATNNKSRGLSIYFPYNGSSTWKEYFLGIYDKLSNFSPYSDFINNFYNIQKSANVTGNYFKNKINVNKEENLANFTLELTDEQKESYAKANFIVFKDNKDGYFVPIYRGQDVSLDGNTLKAQIVGRQLSMVSKNGLEEQLITLYEANYTDDYITYNTNVILEDLRPEEISDWKIDNTKLTILYNKNTNDISITQAVIENNSDDLLPSMVAVNVADYQYISVGSSKYKILDEEGNYTDNWESNGIFEGTELATNDFDLKLYDFNDGSDYYCAFVIYDVNNNYNYSKLIKMN